MSLRSAHRSILLRALTALVTLTTPFAGGARAEQPREPRPTEPRPEPGDPRSPTTGGDTGGDTNPHVTYCENDNQCLPANHCADGVCVRDGIYDPPDLVPLDLPGPPDERTPDDDPQVWLDKDGDEPFDYDTPKNPSHACNAEYPNVPCCEDGQGWSFEKEQSTWDGWTPSGNAFTKVGPVYGNDVHIDRINPPGYTNDPHYSAKDNVGGDYWQYSRDVNQKGKWWAGSADERNDPRELPGGIPHYNYAGKLTSPAFVVSTDFIRFYVGGGRGASQRVQLEVLAKSQADAALLAAAYDGIGVSEQAFTPVTLPFAPTQVKGTWVVVRASLPLEENPFMGRRVAWKTDKLIGHQARIVVIDGADAYGGTAGMPYINVDEVLCQKNLDDDVTWLATNNDRAPTVGSKVTPVPLWGTTDTHAHPFANLAFAGMVQWGDPSDELEKVYDCSTKLDAIPDSSSLLPPLRKALDGGEPVTECGASGDLKALISPAVCGFITAPEAILAGVPAACAITMGALATELDQVGTLIEVDTMHGSHSPMSGRLKLSGVHDLLSWIDTALDFVIAGFFVDSLATDIPAHQDGLIPTLAGDLEDGNHSGHGIKGHQIYQKEMIRRAYQGGMRLLGLDVIESRTISGMMDRDLKYNEWDTIERTVHAIRRMTSCGDGSDKLFPNHVGELCDIAQIAYSPAQARDIIKRDKLAIVLGTETDELGIMRDANDSITKQVRDLWKLGIRKITPVHSLDNPLGGAGVFNDIYLTGMMDLAHHFDPNNAVMSDPDVPNPMGGKIFSLDHDESTANTGHWFDHNAGFPLLDEGHGDDWIGGCAQDPRRCVDFLFGFENSSPLGAWPQVGSPGTVAPAFESFGTWGGVKYVRRADGVDWALSGGDACGAAHIPIPLDIDAGWVPDDVNENFRKTADDLGQQNATGLHDAGRDFLEHMMELGMIIDLDHLSQKSRLGAYQVAEDFGATVGDKDRLYPFFGVHTNAREYETHGPFPDISELRKRGGWNPETDRTEPEFEKERHNGGVFSVGANAGLVPDVPDDSPDFDFVEKPPVRNDCDYSSKSFALRYNHIVDLMGGHGVAISTDMSPFFKPAVSRYGQNQCHQKSGGQLQMITEDKNGFEKVCPPDHIAWTLPAFAPGTGNTPHCKLDQWPHDWYSPIDPALDDGDYECEVGGRLNPKCVTYQNLQQQLAEGSGVEYEDYLGRERKAAPTPMNGALPVEIVVARDSWENRDDGAPRAPVQELVSIGAARQIAPMKKMRTTAGHLGNTNTGWDINIDGFQHIGLMPDFIQDVRNVGVSWERLTPMFNAAEEYVRMWERTCQLADKLAADSNDPEIGCNPVDWNDVQ